MVSKVALLAFLIGCAQAAYSQESAASPAQIAYAISQNYDDTGPGANGVLQQTSSPSPQSHPSTTQQYSSPQYSQQQYQQPQIYTQQHYAQPQTIQYAAQPIAYHQPQAYSQPQFSSMHSSFGRFQMANHVSHPQVSYSVQQQPQVYHQSAQPSVSSYAAQPAYSHNPQVQYSQQPQIAYQQHAGLIKSAHVKAQQQPEASYDNNVQYAYTFDDGQSVGDSKNQHENHQSEVGSYSFVLPEAHQPRPVEYAQEQPQNNLLVQRPSHPKAHESQAYVSQIHKSPYNAPQVSKPVYSSTIAKPVFAAPLAKFSSPIHHQYAYSH